MLNQPDFKNIIWDLLFTYRQFLLNGFLHQRVTHEAYEANAATWNALLLSLESGTVLGLARLLEREKDFGRSFSTIELNTTVSKVMNLRHKYLAHGDLSTKRSASFLAENQIAGGDLVSMFEALKNRALQYQKNLNVAIDVKGLFEKTTQNALQDLDRWLKAFKVEM